MSSFESPRSTSPVTDTESILEQLTRRAEHELQAQPRPTQVQLTSQTRQIFDHYKARGTASSLHAAIARYINNSSNTNNDRLIFSPPLPLNYVPPPPDPKESRMVDEESRHLVRDMPFYVDRKLHIRPDVKIPQGLLESIDRIFQIYQVEAEAMLSHHCEKYGDEPIFRVGIRSLILSRSDTLFESLTSNALSLDPETRLFFLQVFERHPDLNISEKRLLARSARVDTDVVEAFWQNLSSLRAPYMAMRTVIAARELRKQAQHTQLQARLQRERDLIRQRTELMTQRRNELVDRRAREDLQRLQRRVREEMNGGAGEGEGEGRGEGEGAGEKRKKKSPEEWAEALRQRRAEDIRRRMGQRPGPGSSGSGSGHR